MGRFSKVVMLSVLLILSGAPSDASLLCAQPVKPHAHACCMKAEMAMASHCGAATATISGISSCCKVSPIESSPIAPLQLIGNSQSGAVGLLAVSGIAGELPARIITRQFSPRRVTPRQLPLHALLCTFLV